METKKQIGEIVNKAIRMWENGELIPEFYEWEKLDYDDEEVYEKSAKLQEHFGLYEEIAFNIECGNSEFVYEGFIWDEWKWNEDHTQLIFIGEQNG